MEVVEHVNNPEEFIRNLSKLIKVFIYKIFFLIIKIDCFKKIQKDGYLFISTINRTVLSYFVMILGAEYIFRQVPKGTH